MAEINLSSYEMTNPRIYAFTTPEIPKNFGLLKIGYTAAQTVEERIKQQTHGVRIIPKIEWIKLAPYYNGKFLIDVDFHKFLTGKYKVPRDENGLEWFQISPETALKYFEEFSRGKPTKKPQEINSVGYNLRDEQINAVDMTLEYFLEEKSPREFLWNAKPRFGKNLAVYELIFQLDARKVLILTNRPSIATSWYDDFQLFIKKRGGNFKFVVNQKDNLKNAEVYSRKEFTELFPTEKMIAFVSLQDLKGAKNFGGDTDKLQWIQQLNFDLLVVDESHEGVDTDKTTAAFKNIRREFTLYLSGTPFKAIANEKFAPAQIFNWSYADEQNAKLNCYEKNPDAPNPYADLPRMNLFSYRLDKIAAVVDSSLNDFFETANGKFIHEAEVKKFLDALTAFEKFPFSTENLRAELKHTFWLMYRVDGVKAMAKLLKAHPVFSEYEIVIAAGDGKLYDDERQTQKSFDKVKAAIAAHEKTITLSVGQLTTGVNVPEWTAVLMLSDFKSAALYFQAAFRAQTPHRYENAAEIFHKTNCYIFDFSPVRTLEMYNQLAQSLNGGSGAEFIKNLLEVFPVFAENDAGHMVQLDAQTIMSLPQVISANQIVDSGFMSNELFQNILHVFNSSAVFKILRKIHGNTPPKDKIKPGGDDDTQPPPKPPPPQKNETVEQIVKNLKAAGYEISAAVKRQIAALVNQNVDAETIQSKIAAQLDAQQPENDSRAIVEQIVKNLKAAGYEISAAVKKQIAALVKQNIDAETIQSKIAAQLDAQQSENDIRAKLRNFARTIPSFIMAYGDENLTLANFDSYINDKTFEEVTGITIADFRLLRDGGTVDGNFFHGNIFNESAFNAAVKEFLRRMEQYADYFDETLDKDIFDFIPPQKTSQVFTPRAIVAEMVDALEYENPNVFDNPNQKFFDPYMKSGLYLAEIVKRLYKNDKIRAAFPDDNARLKHILENQVYGCAPSNIIFKIATNFIFGKKNISRRNFHNLDTLHEIQSGNSAALLKKIFSVEVFILNRDRVKKFGEVFTPPAIVNQMLDAEELADVFKILDAKILEPTAGDGAFLVGILERKLKNATNSADAFTALNSIFGIEIQYDNLAYARKKLADYFTAYHQDTFGNFDKNAMWEILEKHIVHGDALDFFKKTDYKNLFGEKLIADIDTAQKLKDVIVIGNPPYQADTKGDNKTYAAPVYHLFLQAFWQACDRVMMIHPARCLFNAGGTPKAFMNALLNDEHLKVILYQPNSKEIFPDADIKGGVAVTYRDNNSDFGKIGVFIPFPQLHSVFKKVVLDNKNFSSFSKIVYPRADRKLTAKFFEDYPDSPLKNNDVIGTNAFQKFPQIFFDEKPNDGYEYIQILGRVGVNRVFKWIRRDYVKSLGNLDNYKVFVPSSNGCGALGETLVTPLVGLPLVGLPLVGSTETFTGVGDFHSAAEAGNCLKYIKTKFARALLGILKVTQHNPAETWKYVPLQDFSDSSDVPWARSVAEIDAYLYGKYGLTAEETEFIETRVKAMD